MKNSTPHICLMGMSGPNEWEYKTMGNLDHDPQQHILNYQARGPISVNRRGKNVEAETVTHPKEAKSARRDQWAGEGASRDWALVDNKKMIRWNGMNTFKIRLNQHYILWLAYLGPNSDSQTAEWRSTMVLADLCMTFTLSVRSSPVSTCYYNSLWAHTTTDLLSYLLYRNMRQNQIPSC